MASQNNDYFTSNALFVHFLWENGQSTICLFLLSCSNVHFLFIEIKCYCWAFISQISPMSLSTKKFLFLPLLGSSVS